MNQCELPEDEREPWHSSVYEGLPWFERKEKRVRVPGQGQFPCPEEKLEEYVVNLERINFYGLSRALISREAFYSINRQKVELFFGGMLKVESIPGDKGRLVGGVEKLLSNMYRDYKKEFFRNREIRTLLNQYNDISYIPFTLSNNPTHTESEEFERQKIVHGLAEHVLSCEPCIDSYDNLLFRLTGDMLGGNVPARKRKKLEDLGLLHNCIVRVMNNIDGQLLKIY